MSDTPQSTPYRRKSFWAEVWMYLRQSRLKPLPLLGTLKKYTFKDAKADAKAGLNVALLDFPQSMAYAMIGGLPIVFGLLGSAISSIVGPFFASSRFVMMGPTNASAVLLLSGLLSINLPPEQWPTVLPMLLVMIAVMLLLGALLRVASFVQYISRSVLTGYISAAALLIIVNQIPLICGFLSPERKSTVAQTFMETMRHWHEFDPLIFAIAAATLVIFLLGKRFTPKAPNIVIAIVGICALCALGKYFWPTIFVYPTLDVVQIEAFSTPVFNLDLLGQLASPAFAIAFLCILESASIAKTLAARSGDRFNPNQQMYSLGMANLANAFGGGMPASGSLTRSTLNWSSGARTGVSSIISGVLLLLGLFLLGDLLKYIPKAALAALIVTIGCSLLNRGQIGVIVRSTRSDATAFCFTFFGGIIFPLDTAIYVGAAASIILFLRKAANPELVEIGFNDEGELTEKTPEDAETLHEIPDISIVHVEGDLFFGASDLFLEQARILVSDPNKRITVLRLRNARHLDATAAMAIADLIKFARAHGRDILISGATPDVERVLNNSGTLDLLGRENFFPLITGNPNISTRNALKRAQEILGHKDANIVIYAKPKQAEEEHPAGGRDETTPAS